MDAGKRKEFRQTLQALAARIRAADAQTEGERAPVELDQQAVGRLSRMDALQVQAMALETSRRRAVELRRIAAALARIDEGDYGACLECGEEIAVRRLELAPAAPLCIACASGK
ncbi:MAG: TraR/DksA family transcriptional regulator [Proteobacteria bacterium]|nr:TraR/DksA family transcriptional regulator [Pseudomonadota bacterium]